MKRARLVLTWTVDYKSTLRRILVSYFSVKMIHTTRSCLQRHLSAERSIDAQSLMTDFVSSPPLRGTPLIVAIDGSVLGSIQQFCCTLQLQVNLSELTSFHLLIGFYHDEG